MTRGRHVLVEITNTYPCGRESGSWRWVPAPHSDPSEDVLDRWWDDYVHDLTGDGHVHPGERTEEACYEAVIVEAPDRHELVGKTHEWIG